MLASSTIAHAGCSTSLDAQIASVARVVDSLRPDKPGQMRTVASDGFEYTGGQASWMKGQLRGLQQDCAKTDEVSAAARLRGLQDMLNAHQKARPGTAATKPS